MISIIRHTGSNIGGIIPFHFAFIEDILVIDYNKSTLNCAVTLTPDGEWNYIYGTDESIKLETDSQDTQAGTTYTYKFTHLIPKDRREVEASLRQMAGRGIVIVCSDKNGARRVYGNKENPMRCVSKLLKPADVPGYNGWEVSFYGTFSSPAGYHILSGTPLPNPPNDPSPD